MKKVLFLLLSVILVFPLVAVNMLHKVLPNGMEVVVKENKSNNSVGFFCFVKTGSLNEGKYLSSGISHYLEHIVSGGSTKFKTEEEYQQEEKEMGAITNAFTNQNTTCFHMIADKQYSDRSLKELSEHIMFCAFDTTEVNREKQVILKEIVMRSSQPYDKMMQKQNELNSPFSNNRYPIIGYPEIFKKLTRNDLIDYYNTHYAPNNMIFVAVGNFNVDDVMTKIEDTFKNFERRTVEPVYLPADPVINQEVRYLEEFDTQVPYVAMSNVINNNDGKKAVALDTAFDLLFGKRNAPLRYFLEEKTQLVNYVYGYSSFSLNAPNGEFSVGFEPKDYKDIDKIIAIIDQEIAKYSNPGKQSKSGSKKSKNQSVVGFKQSQIDNLLEMIKAQRDLNVLSIEEEANRIGMNILMNNSIDYYESRIQAISKLTVKDLEDALSYFWGNHNRVIFVALPKGLKQEFEKQSHKEIIKGQAERIVLDKNSTLLYKMNNEKSIIRGTMYLPLTTNYETEKNVGYTSFMTEMLMSGSKKYDSMFITNWLEDHAASININTNSRGTYISFVSLKKDFPEFQNIILDGLINPQFPQAEIELKLEAVYQDYLRAKSYPGTYHEAFFDSLIFVNKRESLNPEIRTKQLLNITRADLQNLYQKYFQADKIIISLLGDLTKEEATTITNLFYNKLPKKMITETGVFSKVQFAGKDFQQAYPFEETNVTVICPAPTMKDPDFEVMQVILSIMNGGSGTGRIHKATRGTTDLAYYAYADYNFNNNWAYFELVSQTSVDKKDQLVSVMKNELKKLTQTLVTQQEINTSIDENYQIIKNDLTDESAPNIMCRYEVMGLGFDYLDKVKEKRIQVKPEDVLRVAKKYFGNPTALVSAPSDNVELMVK